MNVNNINPLTMYNSMQYEGLQSQPIFDTYVPNLSKGMTGGMNSANSTVR